MGLKGWGSKVGSKGWLKGCIGLGLRGWLNRGWLKGIAIGGVCSKVGSRVWGPLCMLNSQQI